MMGGWTAATEVQQEMFSHFALMSVELANRFWPRKLSAAPIGFSFQCETLFKALVEHFIPRLQVVDEEETVGFPRRLLVQLVELLLRQQGALHHGVQLVLVAQPPAAEELHVHPHGCADEPQLLRAHPGTDRMCRPLMKRVSRAPFGLCNCGMSARSSRIISA